MVCDRLLVFGQKCSHTSDWGGSRVGWGVGGDKQFKKQLKHFYIPLYPLYTQLLTQTLGNHCRNIMKRIKTY